MMRLDKQALAYITRPDAHRIQLLDLRDDAFYLGARSSQLVCHVHGDVTGQVAIVVDFLDEHHGYLLLVF